MAHLLHKYHSSALFLGVGMLMLFSFCAPAFASDAPATPTFRSTSPFGINQTIQDATVNINGIHQGTIYKPFSSDHPYADLNPGSGSGGGSGNGNSDDDNVGIGGWMDTPSEPLPIGDGIGILLLMATMMVGAIFLKQRKQFSESISKSTTSTTNINNLRGNQLPTALKKENNTTQHMTTCKQTYQSFFQKLFLLLVFVCFVGQVSADKTIYFRPGTRNFSIGYQTKTQATAGTESYSNGTYSSNKTIWNDIHWIKNSRIAYKVTGHSSKADITSKANQTIVRDSVQSGKQSRFLPITIPTGYTGVKIYRTSSSTYKTFNDWSWVHKESNIEKSNTIPVWSSSSTHEPSSSLSVDRTDGKNLICNREGWWDEYYWAYYLPKNSGVKVYFADINGWDNAEKTNSIQMLTGKDIYTFPTAKLVNIKNTNLYYLELTKEYGYEYYGFILNSTAWSEAGNIPAISSTFLDAANTIKGFVDDSSITQSAWNNGTSSNANLNTYNNRIANRIKKATKRTGLREDLLSGTNLFIPGASNDAAVSKQTLNSWQDLNKTLNFKIQTSTDLGKTYPESNAGGSFTCQTCSLTSATTASDMYTTTITQATGTSCTSAYTATVTFTAIPKAGYSFIGWYAGTNAESFLSRNLTYTTTKENSNTTITAKFAKGVLKNVRSQTCKYTNGKWKYSDSSTGGTFTMTYNNGETYTHTLDEYKKDILVSADDPATFDAHPNDGYTFIGWYNDGKGPYFDDPFTMLNPAEYNQNVTARFAQLTEQTIKATTFNLNTNTFEPSNIGGTVTTQYIGISGGDPVTETTSTSGVGTYKVIKHISNAEPSSYKVTANAADGYTFIGWYNGNNEQITWMDETTHDILADQSFTIVARFVKTELYDKPVTRNFQIQTYNTETKNWVTNTTGGVVNVTYNGDQHVTVDETNPTKISNIIEGSKITMEAAPKENYSFIYWQCQWSRGTNPNCTINALDSTYSINGGTYSNGSYTARFAKLANQTINIQTHKSASNGYQSNADGGSVTISYDYDMTELQVDAQGNKKTVSKIYSEAINDGNPHTYRTMVSRTVTLEVNAQPGYSFLGWYEGENLVSKANPYTYTATVARNITARFAEGGKTELTVRAMIWDGSELANSLEGGSFTMTHSGGIVYTPEDKNDKIIPVSNTPVTFEAAANDDYEFIAWFNNSKGPFFDNPWVMTNPSDTKTYDNIVTAVFTLANYVNKQNINIEGPGTVKTNYTYYKTSTREVTFEQNSSFVAWNSTSVKLTAAPLAGYEFDGWYDENGSELSENSTYSYTATSARTITAKFKSKVNKLTVSVLNYNTSYNEFREYEYEYNTVTLKDKNGTTLNNSYSSFSHTFDDEAYVTITATPETSNPVNVETDYDFVGWLMNGKELRPGDNEIYKLDSETSETLTLKKVSGTVSVSALFAPKKCYHVLLNAQMGGTYSVKYAREDLFDQEGMYYVVQSEYANIIDIYVPYRAKLAVINPQPIHGYKYDGFRVHKGTDNNDGTWTINNESLPDNLPQVIPNFVRKEEQVVYLDISNKDKNPNWADKTKLVCIQRNSHDNKTTKEYITEDNKVDGFENLYKIIIPANTYDNITFAEENSPQGSQYSTTRLVIPATRYNCFKLCASQSSTGEWVDAWTTLPAQEGDFRLVYIEQTVKDKNTIHEDYRFDKAEAIQKRTSAGTDILSLHIYNKVSDGIDGMNNPEVILQRCTGRVDGVSQWEDIERRMIFGPLRATDEGVIRMPGRRNAASTTVVYDNGIDNIKNNNQDNGSGVWNFVISQDGNGNATILADKTHPYEGNYYIRTTNADGQYNNYTYPGNIMTYSAYAAKYSDYTDYFIRYVDIYEDGTPTAEAGKHPVIKFAIANDYAIYLNHEFMIDNDRFKNDEYGIDQFVLDKGGAPNLPADANVRFGWDRVTNRLTRAYIANTTIKNNEYLVVEGDNISPQGNDTYFTDNSNWLYSIDLNATKDADNDAAAKVKAKMNGQYQYFMGSESENETLISGNGAGTYPIRLLYDFKDDRFTTIYRPSNTDISGTVTLETPVMIERKHNEAPTQIKFANNAKFVVNGNFDKPAYAVMTFLEEKLADAAITHHEKMFYWISFPFDVCIRDVFGLGDYGKYWIMEEYNGEQRAKSGLAQNNWKYITKKSHILKKDTGYVLCLNYSQILQDQLFKSYGGSDKTLNSGKLSLYFPSNGVISPAAIKGGQERTVTLEQYDNTTTGSNTAWNHHNWHIIGVPSFADPKFVDLQDDIPFVYEYWHPGDAYAAVSINDVEFQAMHAYMVQYHGKIKWQSIVNTSDGNVQPKALAAKTDEQADKKVMLRLELQQAGSTLDKTYVQLRNDKGTKGFDMSLDLTKIINAGANIYSIVNNHEMAGNAMPKEETVLPLGVVITAAGAYTFAMPQGTEGMIVELIDYEQGTCTNLLVGDYTVNMPVGTNNTRFALRLKPDKVATSVEDITSGTNDNNVRKLLIDGVLYLQQGTNTYDAQGKHVK